MSAVKLPSSHLFEPGVSPQAVLALLDTYAKLHPNTLGKIVVSYLLNFFGPKEWEIFRGMRVEDGPSLADHDFAFLMGPDPEEPHLPAWKIHNIFLGPRIFTVIATGETVPRTLKTLQLGIDGANYINSFESLTQNEDKEAGRTRLLIQRIRPHAVGKPLEDQITFNKQNGYDDFISAIDGVTAHSCLFAWKGERLLSHEVAIRTNLDIWFTGFMQSFKVVIYNYGSSPRDVIVNYEYAILGPKGSLGQRRV